MQLKSPVRIRSIFILYWVLLAYVIAALVWWYIALTKQNEMATELKLQELQYGTPSFHQKFTVIKNNERRKKLQFIGEGITFFLVIAAGAGVVFYLVRKQLKQVQQQQNFMMALTHELKTPIAVAQLNLETLQKRKLEPPQQQRLIQTTLQEANRLNSLCNNMLLASQIDAKGLTINNEEICISEVAEGCINDFVQRFTDRNIKYSIQPNLFVSGDRLLLQMAINNLIDNAVKYSPKDSVVNVTLTKQQQYTVITVTDQGKGIEENEREKIFTKFYRVGNAATKAAKGTGLGLYLTKKIMLQHNGNITMTNNKPVGCIFTAAIPLLD
jgi:two-component system, OmpR family, sensor histidine kinase CiaH